MFYFGLTLPIAEKILQYSPGKRAKLNFELNEELFLLKISHVPIFSQLFSRSPVGRLVTFSRSFLAEKSAKLRERSLELTTDAAVDEEV